MASGGMALPSVFDQGGAPGLQVGRGRLLGPVGLHPGLAGREVGHGQGQVGPGADVFQAQERQQGVAEGELQGVPELPDSPLQARRIGRFHRGVDHDQGGQAHLPPLGRGDPHQAGDVGPGEGQDLLLVREQVAEVPGDERPLQGSKPLRLELGVAGQEDVGPAGVALVRPGPEVGLLAGPAQEVVDVCGDAAQDEGGLLGGVDGVEGEGPGDPGGEADVDELGRHFPSGCTRWPARCPGV